MINKRVELNRSQSVTRRGALKRIGVGLTGVALARLGMNEARAITNGQLDGMAHPNVGGFIWQVSPRLPAPAPLVAGSGVLIHPRVVLTAGHGTDLVESLITQGAMTLNDILVSFASDASDPRTWRAISRVLTHPGYAPNSNSSEDVGVVILNNAVTRIAPIALPPLGFLNTLAAAGELKTNSIRTRFTVVGYGVDPADANFGHVPFPPDGLRRVAQPEFRNLHDRWLYTDQNDSRDNGGTSTGDSGGPLFWVDPATSRETFVAITSRGTLTSSQLYRVDTEKALSFISAVLAMVEAGEL